MNKTYLVGLMTMVVALAGCSNPPVSVKGDVSVVAAKDTETTDQNIHINEANTYNRNQCPKMQKFLKKRPLFVMMALSLCRF